jgi:hypothetical protein
LGPHYQKTTHQPKPPWNYPELSKTRNKKKKENTERSYGYAFELRQGIQGIDINLVSSLSLNFVFNSTHNTIHHQLNSTQHHHNSTPSTTYLHTQCIVKTTPVLSPYPQPGVLPPTTCPINPTTSEAAKQAPAPNAAAKA